MFKLVRVNYDELNSLEYNGLPQKTIYTSQIWMDFLIEEYNMEPVILKIYEGELLLGYFTGGMIKKFGMKILGSPLSGWFTGYMGLEFYEEYKGKKREVYPYVIAYIFEKLKCVYMEIIDQDEVDLSTMRYSHQVEDREAYITNLLLAEDEIYSKFSRMKKGNVRKFYRENCRIVEDYSDTFIDEYYNQLKDVFAKQNLEVHYSKAYIERLIKHLKKYDAVYCIKGMSPNDECVATFIQIGVLDKCFAFGSASYKRFLRQYRPNEAMFYKAMCHYKSLGYSAYDYGGGGEYKAKFGGKKIYYKRYMISKYKILCLMKKAAVKVYWGYKKCVYLVKSIKR